MTRQIAEIVTYENEEYIFAGYTTEIPFNVRIEPIARLTACYRGFKRTFCVKEERLYLQNLGINDKNFDATNFEAYNPVLINGVHPEFNHEKELAGLLFHMNYNNIDKKVDYTGSILIGKNELKGSSLYYRFEAHAAWKYEKVILLKFNTGTLEKADDLSSKMNAIRLEFKKIKSDENKLQRLDHQIKLVFDPTMASDIY